MFDFIIKDDGSEEINWNKINQGHVLHLLAGNTVATEDEADIVYDENTTYETVMSLL